MRLNLGGVVLSLVIIFSGCSKNNGPSAKDLADKELQLKLKESELAHKEKELALQEKIDSLEKEKTNPTSNVNLETPPASVETSKTISISHSTEPLVKRIQGSLVEDLAPEFLGTVATNLTIGEAFRSCPYLKNGIWTERDARSATFQGEVDIALIANRDSIREVAVGVIDAIEGRAPDELGGDSDAGIVGKVLGKVARRSAEEVSNRMSDDTLTKLQNLALTSIPPFQIVVDFAPSDKGATIRSVVFKVSEKSDKKTIPVPRNAQQSVVFEIASSKTPVAMTVFMLQQYAIEAAKNIVVDQLVGKSSSQEDQRKLAKTGSEGTVERKADNENESIPAPSPLPILKQKQAEENPSPPGRETSAAEKSGTDVSFAVDKLLYSNLKATVDGREFLLVKEGAELCLAIQDVRDFDGDGKNDALVRDISACGGNGAGDSFHFISYAENGRFIQTDSFGDSQVVDDPIIVKWHEKWSVLITLGNDGVNLDPRKESTQRYVLGNGVAQKVESNEKKELTAVSEIRSKVFENKPADVAQKLRVDLNNDGKDEVFTCDLWERWGTLKCMLTDVWGKQLLGEELQGKRIGVLDSITKGMRDLVVDFDTVYKWNGSLYKQDKN